MKRAAIAAAMLALGGCASGPAPAPVAPRAAAAVGQTVTPSGPGDVIGSRADALIRRFGMPRLDRAEGDVRKLQFAGSACVLDIYLYPPAAGQEPLAAHVDARLRQGGASLPSADCIREIGAR